MSIRAVALVLLSLTGCKAQPEAAFPDADRPVAPIVSNRFSTEDARDRVGEAEEVMRLAGVTAGMSVADIGAGEGYYTVRLAPIVGARGRVLAQDIVPETRDQLALRVQREKLDNVAVRLGQPDNPMLPMASFDRIFLVHMYHEVTSPYAFLWHLRDGLKPGGLVVVVDANREIKKHGTPPDLLTCELRAVGLERVTYAPLEGTDNYFSAFRIAGAKPEPAAIRPCEASAKQ